MAASEPGLLRQLLDGGDEVRVFDLGADEHRHELVAQGSGFEFERVVGDITDLDAVKAAMHGVDRVIHLAAL